MSSTPEPSPRAIRAIDAALRHLRRRWLLVEVGAAALLGGAALVAMALVWLSAEALFYLPPQLRLAAGPALLALFAATALVRLRRRLGRVPDLRRVALLAEDRCPDLAQRLIAAWELHPVRDRRDLSPSLLDAAAAEAAHLLGQTDPASIVPAASLRRPLVAQAAAALALAAALLLGGSHLLPALDRSLHPLAVYERPRRTQLEVMPGNLEVVRGDEPAIAVRLTGVVPPTARIRRRLDRVDAEGAVDAAAATWVSDEVLVRRHSLLSAVVDGVADTLRYSFGPSRHSFTYQVVAGDARSPLYRVEVIEPPAVQGLRLSLQYPEYSGMAPRVTAEGGDLRALAGTEVTLDVWANKPLSQADVVFESGDSVRARLPARVRDAEARATWRLEAGDGGLYHLSLRDRRGIANRDPIRYAVQVVADGPPSVAITDPGRDTDLAENQRATVGLVATDDLGLSDLALVYRVNDGPEARVPMAAGGEREIRLSHLWDMASLDLLPEDRVYYRAEALDNDAVTGPKRAVSAEYSFRNPSLYELYDELSRESDSQVEALREMAEEEGEAREYVEQLRREVLKSEELTWEQKRELETTLEAEQERARALEDLAEQVAETVEKLEEHGLASEEMVDKLEEIRRLMAEVTSPELQEALSGLRDQLEELDPDDIAAALQDFASDQQAFEERLDRTLDLLRQVRAEQRLEAAARQAADLSERQARVGDDLAGADSPDLERLATQEASLGRDTDRLQSELEDLAQDVDELSPPVGGQLRALAEQMEQQQLSGRMGEMREQLRADQQQAARRTGAGLEEDLGRLSDELDRLQGEFTAEQKRELAAEMRGATTALLRLSHRQEDLARQTADQPTRPADLAADQYALYQGTGIAVGQVARIGQRTLTLSMGVLATLGRALQEMERAAGHLGQRDAVGAGPGQVAATGYLNEAIAMLRESAENLDQAASPSGFAEAMQKMMGLSEQQAALNQATQQALGQASEPGQQGRGRPDIGQQMARLAAEQRRIFRALAELEREIRGHRGMEKRVGEIRREMEGVLREMTRSQPRPQVARSQERILQRMLDASRSIHSRGFEKKRRSETGADLAYEGPAWLPVDLGQSRDRLREAMRAALAADHRPEYRKLIQRYFELMYGDLGQAATPAAAGEALP